MQSFKFTNTVDGDDAPIFVRAIDEQEARQIFQHRIGEWPASMLVVEPVTEIPEDELVISA